MATTNYITIQLIENFTNKTQIQLLFFLLSIKDSEGTVEFLKKFNIGFDVFNCDKQIDDSVYKSPINAVTKRIVFSFLDGFIDYIDGLKLNGKSILKTTRKVPFSGFKSNSIALKMMYTELVESGSIEKICTTGIQQDLLESFFGRMRSRGGNNTNPTEEQFIGNFRRIIVNKELTSSILSNCVDKLQILNVSSSKKCCIIPDSNFIMQISSENEVENEQNIEEFELENNQEEQTIFDGNISHSDTLGVANLAGTIEVHLQRNKKIFRSECAEVFELNDKIDANHFIKNKRNILPCKSTYMICNLGQMIISKYFDSVHISHFDYDKLFKMIKNEINPEDSYILTSFEHRSFVIDVVIEEMIKMRCTAIARIETLAHHNQFVRSAKTHDIHFAGQ